MIWNETCRSEKEAIRTSASLDLVKHPDPFKKEMQKQWKKSMTTYLCSNIGHASIPLAYIIRERETPKYDKAYATGHDQLVECTILTCPKYNINNGPVYDLLQYLTLNGPAWAWINMYQGVRDG